MKKIFMAYSIVVLFIIANFFFLEGQELSDEAKKCYDKGCEILKSAKIPKDYEEAIKEYKNAMVLAPNFPDIYNKLGEIYERLGKYQEAVDNLSKYLSFVTDTAKLSELRTKIDGLENKKKSEEAKKYFDRGCAAFECAERTEDYEDAVKEFNNAIVLDPNFPESYNKLGEVYEKLEKYQEAIDNFNKYLLFIADSTRISELKTKINKLEYKSDKFNKTAGKIASLMGDWYAVTIGSQIQHFKFYKEDDKIMVQADIEFIMSVPQVWSSPKNFSVSLEGTDIIQFSLKVEVVAAERTNEIHTFKMKIVSDKLMIGTLKTEEFGYKDELCQFFCRLPNPQLFYYTRDVYFKTRPPCEFNIDGLINHLNLF